MPRRVVVRVAPRVAPRVTDARGGLDGNADRGCCTTQLWHNAAVAGTAMLDR